MAKIKTMKVHVYFDLNLIEVLESNNIPRVGDLFMGKEVLGVSWSTDLSEVDVTIGDAVNFTVQIQTREDRFWADLDSMPVTGDFVELNNKLYLVTGCIISPDKTVIKCN